MQLLVSQRLQRFHLMLMVAGVVFFGLGVQGLEVPKGHTSAFPTEYTPPKIVMAGDTVVMVGPVPHFQSRSVQGAKVGAKNVTLAPKVSKPTLTPADLKEGTTELMLAAAKGDLDEVRDLIRRGANVNARNQKGSTALMAAATGGYKEVVELLVKKGASVNAKGKGGVTALDVAVKNNHQEVVEILKSNGAREKTENTTVKNNYEKTNQSNGH